MPQKASCVRMNINHRFKLSFKIDNITSTDFGKKKGENTEFPLLSIGLLCYSKI